MDLTSAIVYVLIAVLVTSVILYGLHRKRRIRAGGTFGGGSFFFAADDEDNRKAG